MAETDAAPGPHPIRRVVTGHDDGRATVLVDGAAANTRNPGAGQFSTLLWCTDGAPAPMPLPRDAGPARRLTRRGGRAVRCTPVRREERPT